MPQHWKTYKLGEISTEISYGYTASASSDSVGPKFLRITDIQQSYISWEKVPFCQISEKDFTKYRLKIGDIVIARTGNSTGANAIVKDEIDAVYASYLIRYQIDTILADPLFVSYVLRSKKWFDYVDAIKGGSAQPGANAQQFAQFELSLPPLPEQRAIASILSALDDKIELNLQMNKTLEEMAMALYKHWFVDFGPFKDGTFVESKLGMIPEGWEVKSIFELCEVLNNKRIPLSSMQRENRKGVFPYYGASGIIDYIDDFIFDGEYVIISEDGENLKSRKTPVAFLGYGKFWVNNHAHILRGKLNGINEVIIQHFSELDLNPYLTGAVQPKLNKQNLESVKIPIPKDLELFQKVLNEFYLYSQLSVSNLIENQILSKQRDSLLPKLISGEFKLKANG